LHCWVEPGFRLADLLIREKVFGVLCADLRYDEPEVGWRHGGEVDLEGHLEREELLGSAKHRSITRLFGSIFDPIGKIA
jgi:hypothetical protein